jgi:WD40 repeat protein
MSEPLPLPVSPYKGLVPYDDSDLDARFFFGRERETELVAANLMASRLTVLYGPIGVGKSSLLRAGVVRHLRSMALIGGAAPAGLDVAVVDAWRDDPIASIAGAVGADPPAGSIRLADLLAERTLAVGGELYLVLDQMEEYFLYHRGGPLAAELEEILRRPDLRVHVLLGIRDDALSELDAFKTHLPGLFGNVVRLDHLDREGARSAIVGPLDAYASLGGDRVSAEPALVESVIGQVTAGRIEHGLSGRGALVEEADVGHVEAPYLQLVMERVWQVERSLGSAELRLATLEELGGAARIVEQHLELALEALGSSERDVASGLFDHLVTPSGTKIAHGVDDLARYVNAADTDLDRVLHELAAQRIVRPLPGRNGGGPRFEIFHDVLAEAVLAWRSQHETERALERERADASRRHRRLALIAGAALAALAVTSALAVYAFSQRARADDRARTAKARELTVASLAQQADDPELSLLLALEAAQREQTPAVEDALREALVAARGRRIVDRGTPLLAAALRGRTIATVAADAAISAAAYSRDGRYVARGVGRRVEVDAPDGSRVVGLDLPAEVVRVAVADGRVAAGAADGTVVVAEVPGGQERLRTRLNGQPTALALSGDGRLLVAAAGKTARVVDVDLGGPIGVFGGRSTVLGADLSPDARLLATASADGAVRLWSVERRRLVDVLRGHENLVRAVAFTPDGQRLVSGSADRTARIWRVEDGHPFAVLAGHRDEIRSVGTSPDGRLAVTASADGTARLWDAVGDPELRPVARFRGKPPQLVTVQGDTAVVALGERRLRLDLRSGRIDGTAPSSEQPRLLGGWRVDVDGRTVRLARPTKVLVLKGHRDDVTSVRLSPDGRRLVTASADHDVRIWSTADGSLVRVLKAHVGRVADARFSGDGRWIVTAGPGAAGIWNAESGRLLFYLRGHDGPLTGAAFAPDGRTIVTSGVDGTVRTYDCQVCGGVDELVALARQRLAQTGRRFTPDERARLLG